MKRIRVESSDVASMGFEPSGISAEPSTYGNVTSGTLEVEFKNGSVYQYFRVSLADYQRVLWSDSVGRALHHTIKLKKYAYKRIA